MHWRDCVGYLWECQDHHSQLLNRQSLIYTLFLFFIWQLKNKRRVRDKLSSKLANLLLVNEMTEKMNRSRLIQLILIFEQCI